MGSGVLLLVNPSAVGCPHCSSADLGVCNTFAWGFRVEVTTAHTPSGIHRHWGGLDLRWHTRRAADMTTTTTETASGTPAPVSLITREQVQQWAGRDLSDVELERLQRCVLYSSIPDAISTIVTSWDCHDTV